MLTTTPTPIFALYTADWPRAERLAFYAYALRIDVRALDDRERLEALEACWRLWSPDER